MQDQKFIERRHLEKAMDYHTYRKLIDQLLQEGKTTGQNQSESLTEYARLNVARMRRIDKTVEILPELREVIQSLKQPQTWIVITEGWCGDAAQIVPTLYAISRLNELVTLKLLLRDENLELMDQYLTNGTSRSIPILIVTTSDDLRELFHWGARPRQLQTIFDEMRSKDIPYPQIAEKLHAWYSIDRTISTQKELLQLLKQHE